MKKTKTVSTFLALFFATYAARAEAGDQPLFGDGVQIGKNSDVMEIRFGGAMYDYGIRTKHRVDAVVINSEILFRTPDFLEMFGAPRPFLGGDIAIAQGGYNPIQVVYGGLNWQVHWMPRFYTSASLGGSINNAGLAPDSTNAAYGSNLLFHIGLSAGVDINDKWSIEGYAQHFSNANLRERNAGLEMAGFRMGRKL